MRILFMLAMVIFPLFIKGQITYIPDPVSQDFLESRIIVNQDNVATTLGGTIDPTKEYFIDGVIDCSGITIEVPVGGINIKGFDFDVSQIISTSANDTLFQSALGGSGNVLLIDLAIDVSGANSVVFDLTDATGFNATEWNRVNFNNCTSLGEINGYRQGLEAGTGRFGGTPQLTLSGTWLGGWFIETSIVRSLTDGAYSLYSAGSGFVMNSRFRSNQNIDLPASASFIDFAKTNFVNPSTLQLTGMIISRNGVFDSTDSNYTPNVSEAATESVWKSNNGLPNTFEGGRLLVSAESTTTVSVQGDWYDIAATWASSDLEHFDNPSAGQLRHLGNTPREYRVVVNFDLESQANNDIGIRLRKWDDSASSFVELDEIRRQVNNLVGGRDIAIFNYQLNVILDENDYIYWQTRNNSGTQDITLEIDSDWFIEER